MENKWENFFYWIFGFRCFFLMEIYTGFECFVCYIEGFVRYFSFIKLHMLRILRFSANILLRLAPQSLICAKTYAGACPSQLAPLIHLIATHFSFPCFYNSAWQFLHGQAVHGPRLALQWPVEFLQERIAKNLFIYLLYFIYGLTANWRNFQRK